MLSWLRTEGQRRTWLGKVLGYDGDGRLIAMEHEAGIERVTGKRLESGHRHGSGCKSGFGY